MNHCPLTSCSYANRAKNIKNKPHINEDPKDALLREYQEEILRLKISLEKRKTKKGGKGSRQRVTSSGEGELHVGYLLVSGRMRLKNV